MLFEVVRTWMAENARLTTVRRRKAEVVRDVATQCLPNLFSYEALSSRSLKNYGVEILRREDRDSGLRQQAPNRRLAATHSRLLNASVCR